MVLPQTPSQHPYSSALQLRLYQAFIFSIPILFSIILFLLFYLFYLKRRASTLSSSPQGNSTRASPYIASVSDQTGFEKEPKDKLPTVSFDEELRRRDSQCCVCLGEFEIKEELIQIPSCKHVFHIECINHWLQSNTTCPLCRCFVPTSPTTNPDGDDPPQPSGHAPLHEVNGDPANSQQHQHPQMVTSVSEQRQEQQQQQDQVRDGSSDQVVIQIEEEPTSQTSALGP